MNSIEESIVIIEKIYEGPQTNVFKVQFKDQECVLKEFTNKKVFNNELEAIKRVVTNKIKGCIEWFISFDTVLVTDRSKTIQCLANVIIIPLISSSHINFNNIEKLKKYMFNLVSIVKDLHDAGVYHIDIKPQNFLVDLEKDTYTLIDFSHSYTVNDVPSAKTFNFKGTSYYTPPEIKFKKNGLKKHKIDLGKIDVWSIAMTCLVLINQSKYILSVGNVQTGDERVSEYKKFFGLEFFSWFEIKKELAALDYYFEMDFTWNKLPFFYDTNLYGISIEMQELFNGMLEINPAKRLSIDEVFESPFFSKEPNLQVDKLNYYTIRQYFVQDKAFNLECFNIKMFTKNEHRKQYENSLNFADKLSNDMRYVLNKTGSDKYINVVDYINIGGFVHDCAIPLIFNDMILNSCIRLFYGNDCSFYVDYDTFNLFCIMSLNNKNLFKLLN